MGYLHCKVGQLLQGAALRLKVRQRVIQNNLLPSSIPSTGLLDKRPNGGTRLQTGLILGIYILLLGLT